MHGQLWGAETFLDCCGKQGYPGWLPPCCCFQVAVVGRPDRGQPTDPIPKVSVQYARQRRKPFGSNMKRAGHNKFKFVGHFRLSLLFCATRGQPHFSRRVPRDSAVKGRWPTPALADVSLTGRGGKIEITECLWGAAPGYVLATWRLLCDQGAK